MSDPTGTPTLDPALRALGKQLHERYQLAARIARATWPAQETSPEAMVAATATLFIEINRQLAPTASAHGAPNGTQPPVCDCGTIMAPVEKKNPKMPDWRCPKCDKALWNRDRKRPHASTT
jgi:hypothetical protein